MVQSKLTQQEKETGRKPTVVLGTVGYDCHMVGITVLRHALSEAGFNVVFLRALVAPPEFIDAAVESRADAIWVSSLYGMGRIDCEGFRDKCREAGLGDILIYIGGTLTTDPEAWSETKRLFEEDLGFNRAYPPGTKADVAIADLKRDLGLS